MFEHPSQLFDAVGESLGPGSWLRIDQSRIDAFAEAVGDHEWIHVDRARAAAGPFGGTIAHGFLSLSMVWLLAAELMDIRGVAMSLNYGLDSVRFTAAVTSGSRIRLAAVLKDVRCDDDERYRVTISARIEVEGRDRPALVADAICLYLAEAASPG